MYQGFVHLHSLLRWVILILLVVAIIRHLKAFNAKQPVNAGHKKIDLFLMIAAHTTFLIGLIQYFVGSYGYNLIRDAGFGVVMKNSAMRFWAVEHIVGMLIAIVLITIGRGKVKRGTDYTIHKKALILFVIALVIIVASIPWPFRAAIARPLIPGMGL